MTKIPLVTLAGVIAALLIAGMLARGHDVAASTDSVASFVRRANLGDESSMDRLGTAYQNGLGIAKDTAQAFYWYQKAADQKYSPGQYHLAWLYQHDDIAAPDYTQALFWYEKAYSGGDYKAANEIGLMYETGQGVPQDSLQAEYRYSLGTVHGDDAAWKNLQRVTFTPLNLTVLAIALLLLGIGLLLINAGRARRRALLRN